MAKWAAPPTNELTGVTVEVVVLGFTGVEVTGGAGGVVVTGTGVLAGGALDHSLQTELGTTGGGTELVTTGGAGTVVVFHSDQV